MFLSSTCKRYLKGSPHFPSASLIKSQITSSCRSLARPKTSNNTLYSCYSTSGNQNTISASEAKKHKPLSILIHGNTFEAINAAFLLFPYHNVTLSCDESPSSMGIHASEAPTFLCPPQIPFFYENRYREVADVYKRSMHMINEVRCRLDSHNLFDLDMDKEVAQMTAGQPLFASIHQAAFRKNAMNLLRTHKQFFVQRKLKELRETDDGVFVKFTGGASREEKYDYVIGADGYDSKVRSLHWNNDKDLEVDVQTLQKHTTYNVIAGVIKNLDVEYSDILFDLWNPQSQLQLYSCTNANGEPRIGFNCRIKMDEMSQRLPSRELASFLSTNLTKFFHENGADIILQDMKRVAVSRRIDPDAFSALNLPSANVAYNNFTSNRVALIGQAAHRSTPVMGMSTLQNFYDAQALSYVLNNALFEEKDPNLQEYQDMSKKFYSDMSNKTESLFESFTAWKSIAFSMRMRAFGRSGIKKSYRNILRKSVESD